MKYPVFFLLLLLSGCSNPESRPTEQFQHAAHGSYAAALSADGNYAVVSSISHGVAFWDLRQNALQYQWQHQQDTDNLVFILAISHNNSHVLTADQQTFALWDTRSGHNQGFWQLDDSTIRDIALSDNGAHLLIGKSNGDVQHITLSSGRRLEFKGHTERINSIALSPNGHYALTGGNDYMAYLWDTRTAQIIYSFSHPSRVSKVAIDPKGRYVFTADSMNLAQIWDVQTGQLVTKLRLSGRSQLFTAVRFSDDGRFLITGSPSRKLVLWDVVSGKQLQQWQVSTKQQGWPRSAVVYDVTFMDNNRLISESSSGLAEVWEISND